jgi:hypothetical protein
MLNKLVLHFLDGRIIKGTTCDFSSEKVWFHFTKKNTKETVRVISSELKGVFFVRDWEGRWERRDRYDINRTALGKKVMVCFNDGEIVFGYTNGVSPERSGFFLFFSDPRSNNEKVFVLTAATQEVRLE